MPKKKQPDLTLGCDPEVVLVKGGSLIPANSIIHFNRGTSGFGCDGHPATCEIRPGHSKNLIELIAKTELIFKEAETKFKLSTKIDRILAGHFKFHEPLGGHIHFHQPDKIPSKEFNDHVVGLGRTLDFFLIDCLEGVIADREERQIRRDTGNRYGRKFVDNSDSIRFPREGAPRAEYRVPGSWVINPEVMCTYLFLGKAASLLVDEHKSLKDLSILVPKSTTGQLSRKRLHLQALKKLTKWATDTFEGSQDLEIGADVTLSLLEKVKKDPIDWNQDVREGWNL